jgi:hypothetical protein
MFETCENCSLNAYVFAPFVLSPDIGRSDEARQYSRVKVCA